MSMTDMEKNVGEWTNFGIKILNNIKNGLDYEKAVTLMHDGRTPNEEIAKKVGFEVAKVKFIRFCEKKGEVMQLMTEAKDPDTIAKQTGLTVREVEYIERFVLDNGEI